MGNCGALQQHFFLARVFYFGMVCPCVRARKKNQEGVKNSGTRIWIKSEDSPEFHNFSLLVINLYC
jgi:hypothetical protein